MKKDKNNFCIPSGEGMQKIDKDFDIWYELFGILAWKFQPTKSGDMFLDNDKVYDELKTKFCLKKL